MNVIGRVENLTGVKKVRWMLACWSPEERHEDEDWSICPMQTG